MSLQGGDELRARLDAIATVFEPIAVRWTVDAVSLMKGRVHSPRGRMRGSIRGKAGPRAALVFGDWRLTFQDKGTSAHEVKPKAGRKSSGKSAAAVGYGYGHPNAFFRRKVHVRGVRKKPFIRRSAREALKNTPLAAEVIRAWNAAGGRGVKYTLGSKTAQRRRREAAAARRAAA